MTRIITKEQDKRRENNIKNLQKDLSRVSQEGKNELISTNKLYHAYDNLEFFLINENQK